MTAWCGEVYGVLTRADEVIVCVSVEQSGTRGRSDRDVLMVHQLRMLVGVRPPCLCNRFLSCHCCDTYHGSTPAYYVDFIFYPVRTVRITTASLLKLTRKFTKSSLIILKSGRT